MSQSKHKKIFLMTVLMLFAFFIFGCESKVSVDDIYFKLSEGQTQIVLLENQVLEMNDFVVVQPSYATNNRYTLMSGNENIIKVNGNKLEAIKEGNTTIRVISDDNPDKEDIMTVVVKKTSEKLKAPKNLTYNEQAQMLTFDPVANASGYTLKINNDEINLGNSNTYSLKEYGSKGYDTLLNVQVRANVPSYVYAYITSDYSTTFRMYQSSAVIQASVVGGVLSFNQTSAYARYNVYLGDMLIAENTAETTLSLKDLPDSYAGSSAEIRIKAVVSEETKDAFGGGKYCDSAIYVFPISVLDTPDLILKGTNLSWQNVVNASGYDIFVGDDKINHVTENYFDLKDVGEITSEGVSTVKVLPVLGVETKNVAKTSKISSVNVTRLSAPTVICDGSDLVWGEIVNASAYRVALSGVDSDDTAIGDVKYSLANRPAGGYRFTIRAMARDEKVGDVYYISSLASEKIFTKKAQATPSIEDYTLNISDIGEDNVYVTFDINDSEKYEETITSTDPSIGMSDKNFSAGVHTVKVVRLGDEDNIDSDPFMYTFTQLEAISEINIANNTISVNKSDINADADIRLIIGRGNLQNEKEIQDTSYAITGENALDGGSYNVSVKVLGDGSKTFSYRRNGSAVSSATIPFTVLAKPFVTVEDTSVAKIKFMVEKVSQYDIYQDGEYLTTSVDGEYGFTLDENASTTFKVQAIGNKGNVIDSKMSDVATITRLSTPTLRYNNVTNIITMTDEDSHAEKQIFTHNGESVSYDFASPFDLTLDKNNFTLTSIAKSGENGQYYLDSFTYELSLEKISNIADIYVNANNDLIIETEHAEEYALEAKFIFGGVVKTFTTNGNKLVLNDEELEYVYSYDSDNQKSKYTIKIMDDKHDLILADMGANFSVKVRFVEPSTGEDTKINSEYSDTKDIALLIKTTISRDGQNIRFNNVLPTYTYLNYSLLLDDEQVLAVPETDVTAEGYIYVDVDYIYENISPSLLAGGNAVRVAVITQNVDNTVDNLVSVKSDNVIIDKPQPLVLNHYKYNDNEDGNDENSVMITFDAVKTDFDKEYVLEIYNAGKTNKEKIRFDDDDAIEGVISYRLDNSTLEDTLYVSAYIKVEEPINDDSNEYVFDSDYSNELSFIKLSATRNIYVSDNIIHFDSDENAVGYELYSKTGVTMKKESGLITSNRYNISALVGQYELYIKTISKKEGYTNSSYSEPIVINKLAQPTIAVVGGEFVVTLPTNVLDLLGIEGVDVSLEIVNPWKENVIIDLNNNTNPGVEITDNVLNIESYVALSYGSDTLRSEDVSMRIVIEYTDSSTGVDIYYLSSNATATTAYGLLAPYKIEKTTDDNTAVELISWTENSKNVISGNALSLGYVFQISYTQDDKTVVISSRDDKLQYYDSTTDTYESYDDIINDTKVIFPYSYDGVAFGAGVYEIKVKTMPLAGVSGYNLCSSYYSLDTCRFEIMKTPTVSVSEGMLVWDEMTGATDYKVVVYDGVNVLLSDMSDGNTYYDFSNIAFKDSTGVMSATVQAISNRNDTLNSAIGAPIYVYRLPKASAIEIKDGTIVLTATKYFSKAELVFTDVESGEVKTMYYDNSDNCDTLISGLTGSSIDKLTTEDLSKIATQETFVINISGDAIKLIDGRSYTIDVRLHGNTSLTKGFISSIMVEDLSGLSVTKLKPNMMDNDTLDVNLGVITFATNEEYASSAINYNFGGEESTFWQNASIYKIIITHGSGVVTIYALDYDEFIDNKDKNVFVSTVHENTNDLCASVQYPIDDSNYILFNVYKENKINLRDYDYIYYYPLTENFVNGDYVYTSASDYQYLKLSDGGSFAVSIHLLGGDSYTNTQSKNIGFLTSDSAAMKTFVRYGENELTSYDGKVKFLDQSPTRDGSAIDYPVYRLTISPINPTNQDEAKMVVVYLYYNTLEEAQSIVLKNNPDADLTKYEFVPVERVEAIPNYIIFDMSEYVVAGAYKVNVRALAGFGAGETDDKHYLLNAKEPTKDYTYQKLTDTEFVANNGVLEFAQSYIVQDGKNIYYEQYEITLIDLSDNEEFVYTIARNDAGVSINDTTHVLTYDLSVGLPEIVNGADYAIKVRALSDDNYVLNGTYAVTGDTDVTLSFVKSSGVEYLEVSGGILKWKVIDLDNYKGVKIRLTYTDNGVKYIYIPVENVNRVDENGEYQYHYYRFTDEQYVVDSSSTNAYIKSGIEYSISLVTVGTTDITNILNSNYHLDADGKELKTYRLATTSTIKTTESVLTWDNIDGTVRYEVKLFGGKNYTFNVAEPSIDLTGLVDSGEYHINVKAYGDSYIDGMCSSTIAGFTKLDPVTNIRIDNGYVLWNAGEYAADGYEVRFVYTNTKGESVDETRPIVTDCEILAPTDIDGLFTVYIRAVGLGEGKLINSDVETYVSSTVAPSPVGTISYDEENARFVWSATSDFLKDDTMIVQYSFTKYISSSDDEVLDGSYSKLDTSSKTVTFEISMKMNGYYDSSLDVYYYPINIMGTYSDFSVQVSRPGTVMSAVVEYTDVVDLHLFSYGEGTSEEPYRIANPTHLLNINYFTGANYLLTNNIDLSGVTETELYDRLAKYGALLAGEFTGIINGKIDDKGNRYAIYGLDYTLSGVTDFALFGDLNGAKIQNLIFGNENNQMNLSNMFAKDDTNVINLSLIATGANNSIIENIMVRDFVITLGEAADNTISSGLTGDMYIAGLVGTTSNTDIINANVTFSVVIDIDFTKDLYLGGAIAKASETDVIDSTIIFTPTLSRDKTVAYLGGIMGYYYDDDGSDRSTGISGTTATLTVSNIKVLNMGGLVGYARYIMITNSVSKGTITYANISHSNVMRIGGLVGDARSCIITDTTAEIAINITKVSNIDDKYIGALTGTVSMVNGYSSEMTYYYTDTDINDKSTITNSLVTLGVAGQVGTGVTITHVKI